MIIGAKRILEIISKITDTGLYSEESMQEVKKICDRWINIQKNNIDGSSMVLKKQLYWEYHLRDGLNITGVHAMSTVRQSFLSTMTDEEEKMFSEKDIIEEVHINIDAMTAIRIVDEILKNTKKEKIVVYQNSAPLYLKGMEALHKIIEGQQETIDKLAERLSQ